MEYLIMLLSVGVIIFVTSPIDRIMHVIKKTNLWRTRAGQKLMRIIRIDSVTYDGGKDGHTTIPRDK